MKNFLFIFLILVLHLNIIDALASRRTMIRQMRSFYFNFLYAPLNAIIHLGSPAYLKHALDKSPILQPSIQLFPNVEKLRAAFPIIKKEALAAFAVSKPIIHDTFFSDIADNGWKRFYIKWYGPPDPQALKVCPQTTALIQGMPEVHLAMYSILMPGSKIKPHCGPTRMCLRYHLGISTPNNEECNIMIGGGRFFYSWKDGEDVMFDDTFEHEVVNNTDKPRIILFLDIERPQSMITKPILKAMIKYGGAATTRTNDAIEKLHTI